MTKKFCSSELHMMVSCVESELFSSYPTEMFTTYIDLNIETEFPHQIETIYRNSVEKYYIQPNFCEKVNENVKDFLMLSGMEYSECFNLMVMYVQCLFSTKFNEIYFDDDESGDDNEDDFVVCEYNPYIYDPDCGSKLMEAKQCMMTTSTTTTTTTTTCPSKASITFPYDDDDYLFHSITPNMDIDIILPQRLDFLHRYYDEMGTDDMFRTCKDISSDICINVIANQSPNCWGCESEWNDYAQCVMESTDFGCNYDHYYQCGDEVLEANTTYVLDEVTNCVMKNESSTCPLSYDPVTFATEMEQSYRVATAFFAPNTEEFCIDANNRVNKYLEDGNFYNSGVGSSSCCENEIYNYTKGQFDDLSVLYGSYNCIDTYYSDAVGSGGNTTTLYIIIGCSFVGTVVAICVIVVCIMLTLAMKKKKDHRGYYNNEEHRKDERMVEDYNDDDKEHHHHHHQKATSENNEDELLDKTEKEESHHNNHGMLLGIS